MIQFRPTGAGAGPSDGRYGQPSRRRRSPGVTQRVRVHPLSRYESSTADPLSRRRSCRRNPLSSSAPYPLSSSADSARAPLSSPASWRCTPCRRPDHPLSSRPRSGFAVPSVASGLVRVRDSAPPASGVQADAGPGDGDLSSLPRRCAVTVRTEGSRVERRSSRWCASAPHRGVRTRAHRPGRLGAPPGGGRCATAHGPTAPPHRTTAPSDAVRWCGAHPAGARTPCRRPLSSGAHPLSPIPLSASRCPPPSCVLP